MLFCLFFIFCFFHYFFLSFSLFFFLFPFFSNLTLFSSSSQDVSEPVRGNKNAFKMFGQQEEKARIDEEERLRNQEEQRQARYKDCAE